MQDKKYSCIYSLAPDLTEESWGLRVHRGVQQLCLHMIKLVTGMVLLFVVDGHT